MNASTLLTPKFYEKFALSIRLSDKFMKISAIMPLTGQPGYKKRQLPEVNPGKSGGQTGFLPRMDKVAA
jgi:hypothetical protein